MPYALFAERATPCPIDLLVHKEPQVRPVQQVQQAPRVLGPPASRANWSYWGQGPPVRRHRCDHPGSLTNVNHCPAQVMQ